METKLTESRLLEAVIKNQGWHIQKMADYLGVGPSTVGRVSRNLDKIGKVKRHESKGRIYLYTPEYFREHNADINGAKHVSDQEKEEQNVSAFRHWMTISWRRPVFMFELV